MQLLNFFVVFMTTVLGLNITQMKEIVAVSLDRCEDFQSQSDQDTVSLLLAKIHTMDDFQFYIFEDKLILSCITLDQFC